MKIAALSQDIPDSNRLPGVRATVIRQDDGITVATGTTDVDGYVELTANGAPGNVYITYLRGTDQFRDDSRSMRPYGAFSPAEFQQAVIDVIGDGVVPYGDNFAITVGASSVTISTGAAVLNGVLGVWYTSTTVAVSDGARACAIAYTGTGRLALVDVAAADLSSNHLALYTYTATGGSITSVVNVATPILEGIVAKKPTLQAVVRAANGSTSNASGETSGNEITLTLVAGKEYNIKASASVISRATAGAIAIEIDGNLSSYQANGGDITTTITNSHTRNKTGGSCLIRLFERSDTLLTSWVSDLTFGTTGSGNTNFNNPGQIARDSSDNIYIADTGNARLKKHQADGTYVSSVTSLTGISAVCVDSSGNVYTSRFSGGSRIVTKYNSSLVQQWDVTVSIGTFIHIATDGTNIYATGTDYTVQRLLCSTGAAASPSSFGSSGSGDGQFALGTGPIGIATDGTHIYVTDPGNDRVQKFTTTGTFVSKWGSSGTGDGQFTSPYAIAINPVNGNVFVTDIGRDDVQEFTNTGTFVRKYATLGSGSGQVNDPTGIVVAASGTSFYVADQGNDRIQRFTETASAFTYDSAVLFAKAIPR